jgi:hypothetical protein
MNGLSRRSFVTGLISLVAAPAIVRAGSLMPVKAEPEDIYKLLAERIRDCERVMQENIQTIVYGNADYMPVIFNGVELFFDERAPKNTVYLLTERASGFIIE